jgi:hypothetical protein
MVARRYILCFQRSLLHRQVAAPKRRGNCFLGWCFPMVPPLDAAPPWANLSSRLRRLDCRDDELLSACERSQSCKRQPGAKAKFEEVRFFHGFEMPFFHRLFLRTPVCSIMGAKSVKSANSGELLEFFLTSASSRPNISIQHPWARREQYGL